MRDVARRWYPLGAATLISFVSVVGCEAQLPRRDPGNGDGALVLIDSIGTQDGLGMLEGRVSSMVRLGPRDYLVASGYRAIQRFSKGVSTVAYGRRGQGPGEFVMPRSVGLAPNGQVWVFDDAQSRASAFTVDGEPLRDVGLGTIGRTWDAVFLRDGSLVVNGPGGTTRNLGYLLHHLVEDNSWHSYAPILSDSAFAVNEPVWLRELAVDTSGRVVVVDPRSHGISIWDPAGGFQRVTQIAYRPSAWPRESTEERRRVDPAAPPAGVQDVIVDPCNRLWILSLLPDARWKRAVRGTPRGREGNEAGLELTEQGQWQDSMVEIMDLSRGQIVESLRFDRVFYWLLEPGVLAQYGGDLPHPHVKIFSIVKEGLLCKAD